MSQPIWTTARTVREIEAFGMTWHFIYERGEIVDAEVVEIWDGALAARYWAGLGRTIKHTPAERDGDAERDAAFDMEQA